MEQPNFGEGCALEIFRYLGIGMLVFALFASAFLAIKQQEMYQQYGKHPDEAMFVTVDCFSATINLIKNLAFLLSALFPIHVR